jgi:iron complex outermembrane recepter protein
MASTTFRFNRVAAAAALGCACACSSWAQAGNSVVITGRGPGNQASVAGFGNTPLTRLPMQASVYGTSVLADSGVASIGGLTALDASIGDAYNAEGYWSIVSVRGYTLDNRFNYRRDGLPINAETAIALDNKERVEVLKGVSGLQAGTSAPGGLVNLVSKRATGSLRNVRIEARQAGSLLGALDLGERLGADGKLGLRLNAAFERLDPQVRHTQGERWLLALATDFQLAPDTLLQAELESSHQRQPSVAGFSMRGDAVPDARLIDHRLNLNDQPWRQPVVLDGSTASLRIQQGLADGWSLVAHAMQQRLKSDDRTAFPFGVYDPSSYDCGPCDRFAPDGSFTYWQFISNNERRTSSALLLAVSGQARGSGVEHQLEFGILSTRYRARFQDQIFDIAGLGRDDGSLATQPSAGGTDANTNRDERSTEFFARDALRLTPAWQLWAGLRYTRLHRQSERTSPDGDGSLRAVTYSQGLAAPWLGLSHELNGNTIAYVSWGQGVESDVAPNRPRYRNAGQALPALKSRQLELGLKHEGEVFDGSVALFDIDRPLATDVGACAGADSCDRQIDGGARHRGIEANGNLRLARWTWQASLMWLDAERHGAVADASVNGSRPVNVPRATLRLGSEYRLDAWPGMFLQARLAAEGDRAVLPTDPSVRIPGWSRIDLGARWRQSVGTTTLVWRVGLNNATDRRAWKESPYQFSHVYLYPLAPRSLRASVQASF